MWLIAIPWWGWPLIVLGILVLIVGILMVGLVMIAGQSKEKERTMRKNYMDNEQ